MAGLTLRVKDADTVRIGPFTLTVQRYRANESRVNIDAPPDLLIELLNHKDVSANLESITDDTIDAMDTPPRDRNRS
ncbi:hypothetical protein [uncultured Roseobacter sp.]|uniref:hypothetical protein n=1 Tax=uncultured Roseobacter sp. TaxID=114847 RepID=UPI00262AD90A|nr:hypothetical protein [uncultured Roseobacter sp.]